MPTKITWGGAPKNLILLQKPEGLLLFWITQLGFFKRHGFFAKYFAFKKRLIDFKGSGKE